MAKKSKAKDTAKRGNLFIGTSGWSYEHWQNVFYPEDLSKKDRFAYFAGQFPTVELNATFYRLFPEKTFQNWAHKAPPKFLYAVKLWRWITHRKRLKNIDEDLQAFLIRALLLGDHLGPILVQLPPGLHRNDELLKQFLHTLVKTRKSLKKKFRVTVEFRHRSWLDDDVLQILKDAGAALCLADMPRLKFPRETTCDFTYVRFHGRPQLYRSLYTEEQLACWSDWLSGQLHAGHDVFAYFNNDFEARAVQNARQFQQMLDKVKNAK